MLGIQLKGANHKLSFNTDDWRAIDMTIPQGLQQIWE